MQLRYETDAARFAQRHGLDGVYNARVNADGSEEYQAGWYDEAAKGNPFGGWIGPFDNQTYGITADESGVRWTDDSHCAYSREKRNPMITDA